MNKMCAVLLAYFLCQISYASHITNKIIGVGPEQATISPYFCIQDNTGQVSYALAPGATVDGNLYSGNPGYVGGAIRFGGCDAGKDTYLGYVGISGNKIQYTAPEEIHVKYVNYSIDGAGNLSGNIKYTPIAANFKLLSSSPSKNNDMEFVGINLSGLEFGKVIDPYVIPNLSTEDANGKLSDLKDTQAFLQSGMNTVRIPLHWGFLQLNGPGKGELNHLYYDSYVKPLFETLTSAHVNVIVDLHAYMRYSVFGQQYAGCSGQGPCPDGTLVTDYHAYVDVWTKLFTLIKINPKIDMNYIAFDLVNEPVDVPNDSVFTIQAEVIKSLRSQGFQGYILVEGNHWSGLHSWGATSWKSSDGKATYTNATLFTKENFNKAGITDLSKIIINVHQYLDNDYSGTHDQCVTDLATTGANGFNLNAFVDYLQQNKLKAIVTEFGSGRDSASCSPAMKQFMHYLHDHSAKNKDYGFIGWTIWSTGHGWGDYNLRVTPTSYHMTVLKNFLQPIL